MSMTGISSLMGYMRRHVLHIRPSPVSFKWISPLHLGHAKISNNSLLIVILPPVPLAYALMFDYTDLWVGSLCVYHWSERDESIPAATIFTLRLRRIPIDKRPIEHRVMKASNFMFQQKDDSSAIGIDNRLKPKLVIAHFFGNQVTALEKIIRPGKVGHIDGNMMAIIRSERLF